MARQGESKVKPDYVCRERAGLIANDRDLKFLAENSRELYGRAQYMLLYAQGMELFSEVDEGV